MKKKKKLQFYSFYNWGVGLHESKFLYWPLTSCPIFSQIASIEVSFPISQMTGEYLNLFAKTAITKYPNRAAYTNKQTVVTPFSRLEVQEWGKYQQGCSFWGCRVRSVPSLSPWLVDAYILPVSSRDIFLLYVSVSKRPLLLRAPVTLD